MASLDPTNRMTHAGGTGKKLAGCVRSGKNSRCEGSEKAGKSRFEGAAVDRYLASLLQNLEMLL